MGDPTENNTDQRTFTRIPLRARAVFFPDGAAEIHGLTKDISFNSAILLTHVPPDGVVAGGGGRLHIALGDPTSLAVCFAPFSCQVTRVTTKGVALRFTALKHSREIPAARSRVTIRRSNGLLEADWEIPYPQEPVPDRVATLVQEFLNKYPGRGPAVLCCKRGATPGETRYKIYDLRQLREVQSLAALDPDHRKATSPVTQWLNIDGP